MENKCHMDGRSYFKVLTERLLCVAEQLLVIRGYKRDLPAGNFNIFIHRENKLR